MTDAVSVTAFGAALASPAQAAAVLRARASAAGVVLLPVSDADLAAAVLVAHCWAVAAQRTAVTGPLDPVSAAVLAPALARAAGYGSRVTVAEWYDRPGALSNHQLAALEPVIQWALGVGGREAIAAAAYDLSGTSDVVEFARHLAAFIDEPVPAA